LDQSSLKAWLPFGVTDICVGYIRELTPLGNQYRGCLTTFLKGVQGLIWEKKFNVKSYIHYMVCTPPGNLLEKCPLFTPWENAWISLDILGGRQNNYKVIL